MKTPVKILYLDDDPDDVAIIQSALETDGLTNATTFVQSRDDFVAALENGGIDVILSDSALPTFDGMAALQIVRSRWPAIPLIFVSGMPGEERAIDLLKSGATDYVLKHRLARLAPAVRRALQEAQERKRAEAEEQASREAFRALAARIQAVREEERTHAAREIHDLLAQELTCLQIDVAWLGRKLAESKETWDQKLLQERVETMKALADQASRSVQRVASDLRPVVLDTLGLSAATEWVATDFEKRTGISCTARVPAKGLILDRERSTAVFRILQESLTNITRHTHATKVEIKLWETHGGLRLTVRDNGRGIQSSQMNDPSAMGLLGMRERASLLGGQCTIKPHPDGGTMVEVRLPINNPAEGRATL
jgi:two-component system, NarL family, sensor histidine kinase UhpB